MRQQRDDIENGRQPAVKIDENYDPYNKPENPLTVAITMPKEQMKQLTDFKPFLEMATPEEKLNFLMSTSALKPNSKV